MDGNNPLGLEKRPGGGTIDPFGVLQQPLSAPPTREPTQMDLVWAERRRLSEEPLIGEVRDLTAAEAEQAAALLSVPHTQRKDAQASGAVSRIKAWHHALARDIVSGVPDADLSRVYGCTTYTILRLKRSPAFQSLLQSYAAAPESEAIAMAAKLRAVAAQAVDHLEAMLAKTAPGEVPLQFLEKVLFGLLDRTGHSAVQRSVSLSAGVPAEYLQQLKEKLGGTAPIIDATEEPRAGDGNEAGAAPQPRPADRPTFTRPDPFGSNAAADEPAASADQQLEVGPGSQSPRAAAAA